MLTGSGRAFCAGLDLRELAQAPDPGELVVGGAVDDPVHALAAFPGPVIAAINGAAVTGGLELAIACDVLIASENARFADTHARVGVLPSWGMSQRLPRLIGRGRALEMSLTGNFIDARQALEWGLVNRVVGPDLLMTEALRVAGDMLTVVPEMLVEYRRLIHDGLETSLTQGLALEARRSAEWARTIDPRALGSRSRAVQERGRAQHPAADDTLGSSMALSLKRSWSDPELEVYRDSVVRFIEAEMLPDDEEARKRGHVGHAVWRKAGELGLLCADIPEAVRRRRRRLPPRGGVLRGDGAPRPDRHEHLGACDRRALPAESRHRRAEARATCRAWRAASWSARSR